MESNSFSWVRRWNVETKGAKQTCYVTIFLRATYHCLANLHKGSVPKLVIGSGTTVDISSDGKYIALVNNAARSGSSSSSFLSVWDVQGSCLYLTITLAQ